MNSEKAVTAAVVEAARLGAKFLGSRKAHSVETYGDRYIVRTNQEEIIASRVIISQGNGAGAVCKELGVHLSVLPQVLTWSPLWTHQHSPDKTCRFSSGGRRKTEGRIKPGSTGSRALTVGR